MKQTTQITETVKTNDLRHSILAHDAEGNPIYIKIRLNDEYKNGHQDFSITCDIYEKGKPKTDRYFIAGGCCHDEIIKARPDLKIFVDLHLCDYKGIPMHAIANGFYHLTQGFNKTKPEDSNFSAEYCDHYRISAEQFKALNEAQNQLQFALLLDGLGILAQWERQANQAIKLLEEMTGKTFVIDSKRTQYIAPSIEEVEEEQRRQNEGYYTPEAAQKREEDKRKSILDKLTADRDKDIKSAKTEFEVKKQVLITGGEKALNNCIYYNHSQTISFNWRGYDMISDEIYNKILADIQLPEGVKIENKKGK